MARGVKLIELDDVYHSCSQCCVTFDKIILIQTATQRESSNMG